MEDHREESDMGTACHCTEHRDRNTNAILYNILSQMESRDPRQSNPNRSLFSHPCHCDRRRRVCLKKPSKTCQEASTVLVKTVHFMKNLPAFNQLPLSDQFSLLQKCWAPLFILGLAQEGVRFEVTDTPADSMLKKILMNRQESVDAEREQPTVAGVGKLKSCLKRFGSLDLSPKEYAYLKGTLIFNPDIPELNAALFIEGLQQEAQKALEEVGQPLHPDDPGRFARILLSASMLQSIPPTLLTELFFRPLIGQADLVELLVEMLLFR
ncbi:nuclear receptor subfamily 0 group B member 2a [Gadus chalcogrammus]|uniref:nuclear receptor subfamily 0 group B member 2a n=1 Tax=Gadus chalcogrammus TaxID=1042646 RepID=UPI0024C2E283|nr:nuclear receptor subfamily 0 group B member 2a [Gadus chalcogrammus]